MPAAPPASEQLRSLPRNSPLRQTPTCPPTNTHTPLPKLLHGCRRLSPDALPAPQVRQSLKQADRVPQLHCTPRQRSAGPWGEAGGQNWHYTQAALSTRHARPNTGWLAKQQPTHPCRRPQPRVGEGHPAASCRCGHQSGREAPAGRAPTAGGHQQQVLPAMPHTAERSQ